MTYEGTDTSNSAPEETNEKGEIVANGKNVPKSHDIHGPLPESMSEHVEEKGPIADIEGPN